MAGLLSDNDLADLEAEMIAELVDSCDILEKHTAPDGEGGTTDTYVGRDSGPCAYGELTGRELIRAQQIAAEADMVVTLVKNRTVLTTDQLVITNSATGEIITAQVVYVNKFTQESWRSVFAVNLKA